MKTTAPSWTREDLRGTARALETWWDLLTAGLDETLLAAPLPGGSPSLHDLRAATLARLPVHGPYDASAADFALATLSRAGRAVAALGAGVPTMSGSVVGVHVSDGGVPKRAVDSAYVGERGLVGDRQAARQHHGRVWQALCLWSAEVIQALQAEGHPIAAGNAGENLTVAGLDWAALRPGARLRLGDVLAEVSVPALPCVKNARWFHDGYFMRMHHERHPGQSRWYARVLCPGQVRGGDPVVVEPVVPQNPPSRR